MPILEIRISNRFKPLINRLRQLIDAKLRVTTKESKQKNRKYRMVMIVAICSNGFSGAGFGTAQAKPEIGRCAEITKDKNSFEWPIITPRNSEPCYICDHHFHGL